jgi:predicted Fe-Mo cluster-binding NifX family protein
MSSKRQGFKNRDKKERGEDMKICFPVLKADGIESEVHGHFGSAPQFVVVDTVTNSVTTIINKDKHHVHGTCTPLKALDNHRVDALVVSGIGAGALSRLNQSGVAVFQAQALTIKENLALLKAHTLPEFIVQQCCSGHGHGSGCGH